MAKEMKERKEIVKTMVFPNGVNRVHIPILTEEEEKERQKRLYDAAVRLLKAQQRCHMKEEGTV